MKVWWLHRSEAAENEVVSGLVVARTPAAAQDFMESRRNAEPAGTWRAVTPIHLADCTEDEPRSRVLLLIDASTVGQEGATVVMAVLRDLKRLRRVGPLLPPGMWPWVTGRVAHHKGLPVEECGAEKHHLDGPVCTLDRYHAGDHSWGK